MTTIDYRGWQIESDDDGHATVWDSDGCEHWEVGSVPEARSMIDRWLEPGPFAGLVRRADR
jgi:hypothetical protein